MPHPSAMERLVVHVGRLAAQGSSVLRPLPRLADALVELDAVEARTQCSVWNMQREIRLPVVRLATHLDARSRSRQVEERTIYPVARARTRPLVTTFEPAMRLAPVDMPLLVADERDVVLGLAARDGDVFAWACDDPEVAEPASRAFLETWKAARSWEEAGLRPPLAPRRFHVALGMADGLSDREIAETLGVSPRTVAVEVRAVLDWLGARNRGHGIAMLVGAA
ncbi:helix-turn-helix transcriptional regulator [Phycicoccus sp. MAQZ13P-2]|uniref:helix-turn-helix transcriptional regulator n=1 Tax=Phycicoccus mangrovi TaxID=2840470 RepID=UPI001C0074E6|nr:helix-turn-helix transcriptional regulator [Phycicoccus mangrovi]MBT9257246.1 helix-turn-helix transcriptional regulator [Phycicoccus mangrovi]MBT9276183.1 helix-turn-helix transcriptional regulator [Phycicoccus mangrovi]